MRYLIQIARYAWPAPYTLTGIAIGLLLFGRFRRVNGVVEIHSPQIAAILNRLYVPALAMTFGHVVFGQSQAALDATRDHEHVHVRQYERWGIVFVPADLAASAYLLVRGRDAYRENPFEIEAYSIDRQEAR
mgnify:CR=1 FL=1